jgi:hypothetical protein
MPNKTLNAKGEVGFLLKNAILKERREDLRNCIFLVWLKKGNFGKRPKLVFLKLLLKL